MQSITRLPFACPSDLPEVKGDAGQWLGLANAASPQGKAQGFIYTVDGCSNQVQTK